jgi:hypothetical protein
MSNRVVPRGATSGTPPGRMRRGGVPSSHRVRRRDGTRRAPSGRTVRTGHGSVHGARSGQMSSSTDRDRARTTRRALGVALVVGWLLGFAIQVAVWAATGWVEVLPPSLLLGLALCAGAGSMARLVDDAPRARRGAVAGIAMVASIAAGYAVFVSVVSGPTSDGAGGETWLSLLLEVPLWLGIPAVTGAVLGAFGWHGADHVVARSAPGDGPGRS